jgi:hypothetical protein
LGWELRSQPEDEIMRELIALLLTQVGGCGRQVRLRLNREDEL